MAVLTSFPLAMEGTAAAPRLVGDEQACVAVPGVDDRCEIWSSDFKHQFQTGCFNCTPIMEFAASPTGDRLFVAGPVSGDYGVVAFSQSTGARLWTASYGGPDEMPDEARAITVSPDGSTVFVTGRQDWSTEIITSDIGTVAFDAATGERLWVAEFDQTAGLEDVYSADAGLAAVVSPDGSRVYVTGATALGGAYDAVTLAYDSETGEKVWERRFNAGGTDAGVAIGISPDGSRLFITGHSQKPLSTYDYATIAYDLNTPDKLGAQLWVSRYVGSPDGEDLPSQLEVAGNGKLYVSGYSNKGGSITEYATVAYSQETGEQVWASRYSPTEGGYNTVEGLAVSPDGSRVFVTGTSQGTRTSLENHDYATVAYDGATGAQRWVAREGTPLPTGAATREGGRDVVVSPDGNRVYVTGGVLDAVYVGSWSAMTIAYDPASGARVWTGRFDPVPGVLDSALGVGIAVSPDSSRVMAAVIPQYWMLDPDRPDWTPFGTHYRYGVVAYDA